MSPTCDDPVQIDSGVPFDAISELSVPNDTTMGFKSTGLPAAAASGLITIDATMLTAGAIILVLFIINVSLVVYFMLSRNKEEPSQKQQKYAQQPPVQYVMPTPYANAMSQFANVKPPTADMNMPEPSKPPLSRGRSRTLSRSGSSLSLSGAETLEEAQCFANERNEEVRNMTPQQILDDLKLGNQRFWNGTAERPEMSALERRCLTKGQVPKVAVISCADSRVAVEIVLDQGLGDVFVMRNAGNLYCDMVAGTVDYAIHHLGIKVVVVMGHQSCGAVKAARLPTKVILNESPKLKDMLLSMKQELAYCEETISAISDPAAQDREAVCANAKMQVRKLLRDKGVQEKVAKNELLIVAGFYDIGTGVVDFMDVPMEIGDNE